MSITKSYNKETDTYYAYETTYVWDETKQKKVPKRKCVGHYDPETWEIIPNSRRGRPSLSENNHKPKPYKSVKHTDNAGDGRRMENDLRQMLSTLENIESSISALNNTVTSVKGELTDVLQKISPRE